jgi:hypothetical protein
MVKHRIEMKRGGKARSNAGFVQRREYAPPRKKRTRQDRTSSLTYVLCTAQTMNLPTHMNNGRISGARCNPILVENCEDVARVEHGEYPICTGKRDDLSKDSSRNEKCFRLAAFIQGPGRALRRRQNVPSAPSRHVGFASALSNEAVNVAVGGTLEQKVQQPPRWDHGSTD